MHSHGTLRIFSLFLFLLGMVVQNTSAQSGFPDWHQANIRWAEAGYDTFYYRSDNGATLAWGETYNLQTYNLMYQVDADTIWLHKLAKHGLEMMRNAKDVPADTSIQVDPLYRDGYLGWGNASYTGQYEEYLVWDGHFGTELAKFIRAIYENDSLYTWFGNRADTLLHFLEENVVDKWYSIWDHPRVAFPGDISTNDTYRAWIGGDYLSEIPVNRYAAFGNFLLELMQIARTNHYQSSHPEYIVWYEETVLQMVDAFRSMLEYDSAIDAYLWGYSTHGHNNDLSHSAIEVAFAYDCYKNGIGFTLRDMKRFAHTLTRHLWKNPGDIWNAELWDSFSQDEWSNLSLDAYSRKWALLGMFDPLACAVESGVMRELAESGNYSSGVYAAGIAALALVNKDAFPVVAATGLTLNELSGDGDDFPDPAEELELAVHIANWGHQTIDSLWASIECSDERVEIVRQESQYHAIVSMDTLANSSQPFIFKIKANTTVGGIIRLFLTLQTGAKSRRDSINLQIGPVPLLLVDDDGGLDYETAYIDGVLDSLSLFQYWDTAKKGSPAAYLADFEKIIWFTGDRRVNILPDSERTALGDYLDRGGKLLLFSAGVEQSLLDSVEPDTAFLQDYLHALANDGSASTFWITTKVVQPGIYPSQYLVVSSTNNSGFRSITAGPGALPLLQYSFGDAAIFYNLHHHVVYFTFGLENIQHGNSSLQRRFLLSKLLQLLDQPASVRMAENALPDHFDLRAFPNPFNAQVAIEIPLSSPQRVQVSIFDVRGRLVQSLFDGQAKDGIFRCTWDGTDENGLVTSSGIYFIQFKSGDQVQFFKISKLQ